MSIEIHKILIQVIQFRFLWKKNPLASTDKDEYSG